MTTAPKTAASREQGTKPRAEKKSAQTKAEHGATLPVPVVTPHLKVYRLRVRGAPGVHDVVETGRSATSHLPPPEQLAFYGGLGALAAFGLVSWPVAAAIGVGTVVARRARGGGDRDGDGRGAETPARKPAETA